MLGIVSTILGSLMLALPIGSSVWLMVRRRTKVWQWLLWTALVSAACYVLLMLSNRADDIHLQNMLDRYDLDGDGIFSGEERTIEMEQAMDATNSTGRAFEQIVGLIICPFYSAFWHCVIGVPYLLFSARKPKTVGEQVVDPNA